MIQKERSCCWAIIGDNKALTSEFGPSLFQQVRRDSYRHLLLTGMSRFLMSKPKQQD